jgi:hypothetical protein
MSRGGETRFKPGKSGNPKGRPKKRPAAVSAFDVVLDQILTIQQNGVEREFTVEEGLQLQTYQAALKGKRQAVRTVLKWIEKREKALAKLGPPDTAGPSLEFQYEADNAEEAMVILGILNARNRDPERDFKAAKLQTWATQAAVSRPGRRRYDESDIEQIKRSTVEPERIKWPRGYAVKPLKKGNDR